MVFGGQQENLAQSVSVPMPEAIQAIKQVKPSKLLKQMVFGGQQECLVQSVSVPMPEAIQAVKQVEVVFSGPQDKSSSQYTTNRVW